MMNNADNSILALYGGTFDPVHQAHINTVKAMAAVAGAARQRQASLSQY